MIYTTFKNFRVDLLSWTHAQDATFSLLRHLGLQRHQISLNPFSAPTHFQFSACRNSFSIFDAARQLSLFLRAYTLGAVSSCGILDSGP
jgi:hypothetical protein